MEVFKKLVHGYLIWPKSVLSHCPVVSNNYNKRSKISVAKMRQTIQLFSLDIDATNLAELTYLTRKQLTKNFPYTGSQ